MADLGTAVSAVAAKSFNTIKLESVKDLNELQSFGYRLLLLGFTSKQFTENRFYAKFSIYSIFFFFHTLYATYELVVAILFSRSLLEGASHGYIATYLLAFNSQWYFLLLFYDEHNSNDMRFEDFNSTKAHPDVADDLIGKNLKFLTTILKLSVGWWALNSMTHTVGPVIEEIYSFIKTGDFISVYVLPPVFETPWWAQILIYISNTISMTGLLVYCAGSYTVMGIRVLKIKTQCDIINHALIHDCDEPSNVTAYIDDHVKIIKNAQYVTDQLAVLNTFMFLAVYLEFALQMFALTLIEPSGAYYFAMAFDLLSIFLILAFQCAMGSMITHSLESIGQGASFSPWYERGKNHARNLMIMIQIAQKPILQRIWMGSIIVERATTISLARSSYAIYTLLMILQKE